MSRPPGAAAVVLAAALAAAGAGLQAATDPGPPPEAPPLGVATWNVHRYLAAAPDGRVTLADVRDTLATMDPHLVGLQETEMGRPTSGAFDAPGWLGRELGLHVAYGPPTRDQIYGVALLSAYPVLDQEVHPLPTSGSIERVATEATVDAPGGPLAVVVAHLSVVERPGERADQARALVDLLADHDRAILVGDMNTPADRGEEAYEVLAGNLTDAWRAAGHPPGSGATAFGDEPTKRVDHVWVKGDWTVDSASLHGDAAASDHRAVLAQLAGPALG